MACSLFFTLYAFILFLQQRTFSCMDNSNSDTNLVLLKIWAPGLEIGKVLAAVFSGSQLTHGSAALLPERDLCGPCFGQGRRGLGYWLPEGGSDPFTLPMSSLPVDEEFTANSLAGKLIQLGVGAAV
jgi:hypothetical protein